MVEDTDGDGLPDQWERDFFGNLSQDGNGDPDGDGKTNLEEFQNGSDPTVFNYLSSYSSMTLAGTFQGWNPSANNMALVDDYQWECEVDFNSHSAGRCKFVANGSWTVNWGDQNQFDNTIPIFDEADRGVSQDIVLPGTLNGRYRFFFNEQTRQYSVEKIGGSDIEWLGQIAHWPQNGAIDPGEAIWIDAQTYPIGSAGNVSVIYSRDGGSTWLSLAMNHNGTGGNNDKWNVNAGTLSSGETLFYHVVARDLAGRSVTNNYGGFHYRAHAASDYESLVWAGNTYHWPHIGQVDPSDNLYVNIQSYPIGAAVRARVVYSVDGGTTWNESPMNHGGTAGNNDKWYVNLQTFPSGTVVEYAVELIDGTGAAYWDSNNNQNFFVDVN